MIKKNKKAPVKINLSSTQVLKTLLVLMEGDYTMSELVQKLNANEEGLVFNNSVISKYINSCKFCGVEVVRVNNRYTVIDLPFGVKLSGPEQNLILLLRTEAQKKLRRSGYKSFERFLKKLYKYSRKEILKYENVVYETSNPYFEKAIIDGRKILITLKNKSKLKCIPVDICERNGRDYYHVVYNDKEKLILRDKVIGITTLNDRYVLKKREENVVFKLTGKLAYNYNIRENEKIISNDLPQSITVINYNESKVLLIPRLLRYGDLCEIISPADVREEVKNLVENTLANYGE